MNNLTQKLKLFLKAFNISNLKIRTKFIFYVIIILCLFILIAFVSIMNTIKIKNNIDSIYNKELTGLTLLYPIYGEFSNLYLSLDEIIKENNSASFNDIKAKIDFSISNIDKLKSNFELTINSQEVKKEFELAELDYEILTGSINQICQLAKSNEYNQAQYKNALISNVKTNITTYYNNMIIFNQKFAKSNYESSNLLYKHSLFSTLILVIFTIIISIFCSLYLILSLTKKINEIMKFSKAIGNNDFSYQIKNISKDEIGEVIESLNKANTNIKTLVSEVIDTATIIRTLNTNISNISDNIVAEMTAINSSTVLISNGSSDVSNSTINVTKAVEEIVLIASNLTLKAKESVSTSNDIKSKANKTKERGLQSVSNANSILIDKNNAVQTAIKKGAIVNEIVSMTNLIKDISQKTNLLSINASIEAANAGDKGKGFGVVANEVKTLASQTNTTVKNIQLLVKEIQLAFENISLTSSSVLSYLSTDVRSDYELLLDIANNYENSALTMNEVALSMEYYAQLVLDNINEVTASIQNVTAISEEANYNTEEITLSINNTSNSINIVNNYIKQQNELTNKLNNLMKEFKI